MFLSSEPRRILAYAEPVDLRKSIIGLVALVQSVLQEDSLSGCVYVFFNRRGNYLKLVTWDHGVLPVCEATGEGSISTSLG